MSTKPVYVTSKEIAREIGMNPHNISRIIAKWKLHPTNPCPSADAYQRVEVLANQFIPLWNQDRIPEWQAWKSRRDELVRSLQRREEENRLARIAEEISRAIVDS